MFINSKHVIDCGKCSNICKSGHEFGKYNSKYEHEFKNCSLFQFVYDFTKLRVIVYLGDVIKCGHGL